jgi:hypothetical protein
VQRDRICRVTARIFVEAASGKATSCSSNHFPLEIAALSAPCNRRAQGESRWEQQPLIGWSGRCDSERIKITVRREKEL